MANVNLGFREVLLRRATYIILWHLCIQTLILQFVASVNISEDLFFWMITWLKNLFKPRFFVISLFQLFLSVVCIITESTKYLRVEQCDNMTRFRYFCRKFSPNRLIWFFVYFLQGILSAIVFFIALKHYFVDPLDNDVQSDNNNVTETIIILLINAVWINILFYFNDFIYHKSFTYFPLIQHTHCVAMPTIVVVAKDAAVKSFYFTTLFIIFYLLKGHSFCSFICYSYSVKCNISYTIIFHPFLLYCLWLLNALILFNNLILKLLFEIFLTAKIDFPINNNASTKQNETFTLKDALSTDNIPLIQYLGYYDLNIISQFDETRRKQIFSLSYPGGHPHTWREIAQEALKLIQDTIDRLEKIMNTKPNISAESQKYPTIEKFYSKMRPLSVSHYNDGKYTNVNKASEENILSKMTNALKNIRFVAYLMEEMTEKQLESALQNYQALSLACYSLSNLAAASKVDDKYGIVLQDLPQIINSMLQLNVTLNKLIVIVNKRPNSSILQIKKYLTSVVKSSLYKMSINFGAHIKDLNLKPEDEKLFSSFILFKN